MKKPTKTKTDTYVCRERKLYEYLYEKGVLPYKTARDKYDSEATVWLYDDTERLRKAIREHDGIDDDVIAVKRIFTKRLAAYLRKKGCTLVKTVVNEDKPQFDIYIFENDERLINSMIEYADMKKR